MKLLYVSVKLYLEPPRRPRERKIKRNENFKSEFGTTQSTTESFQYVLYAYGRKIFISSGSSSPGCRPRMWSKTRKTGEKEQKRITTE